MGERKAHPALGSGRALAAFQALSELPAQHRDTILALAGMDPQTLGRYVRAAFGVLADGMNATKVNRLVVSQGKDVPAKVAEYVDIDTTARLTAADALLKVAGMYPSRAAGTALASAAGQPVTITVRLAHDLAPHMQAPAAIASPEPDEPGTIDALTDHPVQTPSHPSLVRRLHG